MQGIVVGRIRFRDDGDLIDCTRMGVGGKAIPPYIDRITDIQSDAEFILLVEKDAAFMRLAEDRCALAARVCVCGCVCARACAC
jgi:meiotic recombination protein SPO11